MRRVLMRHITWYLIAAMFVIGIAPRVDASFSPSGVVALPHTDRARDLNKIQQVLENRLVAKRLADLGFSQKEINSRLSRMSDHQIHQFAQKLGSLKVGGDGAGFVIALLVVVILVILILQLTGHKVIVR